MNDYSIQTVSQMTDLSISTLRYYEQMGLLDPVARAANGHRCYSDADLQRIEFLKRVRAMGMSMANKTSPRSTLSSTTTVSNFKCTHDF
jgi:DNA-binding transcriptional MerR regulator